MIFADILIKKNRAADILHEEHTIALCSFTVL